MEYEEPTIVDHGTIADHTYTNSSSYDGSTDGCSGVATPPKDTRECKLDCFGEYSCPTS